MSEDDLTATTETGEVLRLKASANLLLAMFLSSKQELKSEIELLSEIQRLHDDISQLRSELEGRHNDIDLLRLELHRRDNERDGEIERLHRLLEISELQRKQSIAVIQASTSWRMTAPFRFISQVLRHMMGAHRRGSAEINKAMPPHSARITKDLG